jgi:hypothetical protein
MNKNQPVRNKRQINNKNEVQRCQATKPAGAHGTGNRPVDPAPNRLALNIEWCGGMTGYFSFSVSGTGSATGVSPLAAASTVAKTDLKNSWNPAGETRPVSMNLTTISFVARRTCSSMDAILSSNQFFQ